MSSPYPMTIWRTLIYGAAGTGMIMIWQISMYAAGFLPWPWYLVPMVCGLEGIRILMTLVWLRLL